MAKKLGSALRCLEIFAILDGESRKPIWTANKKNAKNMFRKLIYLAYNQKPKGSKTVMF